MKNDKTFLKIGFVLGILIMVNEISYLTTGNGVGLTALILVLAALVTYIFFYLITR